MWPKANFDQVSKFHFLKFNFKQIAPRVSTGRELSLFWMNGHIIGFPPQTQKVRVTLQNSIRHSGSERIKITDAVTWVHEICSLWVTDSFIRRIVCPFKREPAHSSLPWSTSISYNILRLSLFVLIWPLLFQRTSFRSHPTFWCPVNILTVVANMTLQLSGQRTSRKGNSPCVCGKCKILMACTRI